MCRGRKRDSRFLNGPASQNLTVNCRVTGFVSLFLRLASSDSRKCARRSRRQWMEGAPTTYYWRSNIIPSHQLRVDLKSQSMRLAWESLYRCRWQKGRFHQLWDLKKRKVLEFCDIMNSSLSSSHKSSSPVSIDRTIGILSYRHLQNQSSFSTILHEIWS